MECHGAVTSPQDESSAVEDVIEDLQVAIADFAAVIAEPDASRRRTLRTVLACLYELRVYREGVGGLKSAYYSRAGASDEGKVTEGLIWLRGKKTHFLVHDLEPHRAVLYPGENVYPSEDLYPGSNLVWLPATEVSSVPLSKHAAGDLRRRVLYDECVADQPVLAVLRTAARFLVHDPGPCP